MLKSPLITLLAHFQILKDLKEVLKIFINYIQISKLRVWNKIRIT